MFMEFAKHFFYLCIYFFQVRDITIFIKKNGVAFNFRYLETDLVGINDNFKQFLYDMAAMINLHRIHKTGEATDIRNKYEAFVVHCEQKTIRNYLEA